MVAHYFLSDNKSNQGNGTVLMACCVHVYIQDGLARQIKYIITERVPSSWTHAFVSLLFLCVYC